MTFVTHLECSRCGKRREPGGVHNLYECGGPFPTASLNDGRLQVSGEVAAPLTLSMDYLNNYGPRPR